MARPTPPGSEPFGAMTDRICFALPDGRWLVLDRETFEAGLAAGTEFARPADRAAAPLIELLTAEQVADRLKLPQSWVEEATRQGRLPCHEFGRYKRYSLPAVIEAAERERRKEYDYEH
jgi:excisionase family DNA binding protein